MKIPIDQVAYAFVGLLFLLGMVAMILKRFDLLSFGKSASCPDCADRIREGAINAQAIVESRVSRIETDIQAIKVDNTAMWQKLDKISDDVSYIRGWVSRNGDNK